MTSGGVDFGACGAVSRRAPELPHSAAIGTAKPRAEPFAQDCSGSQLAK
jgi:hypothetical protein